MRYLGCFVIGWLLMLTVTAAQAAFIETQVIASAALLGGPSCGGVRGGQGIESAAFQCDVERGDRQAATRGEASAAFGPLSAVAGASAVGGESQASAEAGFLDEITISSPEFDGRGRGVLAFELSGTESVSGDGETSVFFRVETILQNPAETTTTESLTGSGSDSVFFDFIFGQPFFLDAELRVLAGVPGGLFGSTGNALADFGNTAFFTSLDVEAQGEELDDFSLTSESGEFTFGKQQEDSPSPVPAPTTLLLFITGLVAAGVSRRRWAHVSAQTTGFEQ